jgi:hypothetical protein
MAKYPKTLKELSELLSEHDDCILVMLNLSQPGQKDKEMAAECETLCAETGLVFFIVDIDTKDPYLTSYSEGFNPNRETPFAVFSRADRWSVFEPVESPFMMRRLALALKSGNRRKLIGHKVPLEVTAKKTLFF